MTQELSRAVLAVDGGGTRCRMALATPEAHWVEQAGPVNVSSDFDGAICTLNAALTALAARAGARREALLGLPAYLGLAGVTGDALATKVAAALPFSAIRVTDDRPPALLGALGGTDGFLAHCGTGSFTAMQSGEHRRFAGGWGLVLGDDASAAWVGKTLLSRCLAAADGTGPTSALTEAVLAKYQGGAGLIAFAAQASPSEFGALAPLVTKAAPSDEVARAVMQAGADALVAALGALGWTTGAALCLTGGIGPHFAPFLPPRMQSALRAPAGSPLDGALILARHLQQAAT